MCAIIGALIGGLDCSPKVTSVNLMLGHIADASLERGRDGFGYHMSSRGWPHSTPHHYSSREAGRNENRKFAYRFNPFPEGTEKGTFIANLRAEPTTEFVADKRTHDQQPYGINGWNIVHNGTIANDKALRTNELPTSIDSAAIVERLAEYTAGLTGIELWSSFKHTIRSLQGSFAIIATHHSLANELFVAVNYRPLWYIKTIHGVFFASARHYFPEGYVPEMVKPYTAVRFVRDDRGKVTTVEQRLNPSEHKKALVVCSGGMDSVVAAAHAIAEGCEVELIHFMYGSRAEGPEVRAVQNVANYYGINCTMFPLPVYKPGDSPLLQADSTIAGGEAGAEFAHEWVPARNLLLLSVATAYAEANGFTRLVLGNNLEEAGAYPDNEPEFIAKFNDLLPFAIGDGAQLTVSMPVGNMMKHEIVALAEQLGAPLHLTWSCYRAGAQHCGTCGPCYMRRTAFAINLIPEVIEYEA